ncbi:hypothetical protein MJO29_014844 [Puccinia striiformis f. sp. tritici]|nr:hypothetical protein MJO29_014844 [Puccinia striiformis f. sp. tritici]
MQSTFILSCLAFLALSHQAISMEARIIIAGADTVEAPVVKPATSRCRGCRCDQNVPQHVPSGHGAGKSINFNSGSVSSVLALYPDQSPHNIARKLFPTPSLLKRIKQRFTFAQDLFNREEPSAHRIQLAYQSGRWSTHEGSNVRPSELFLKMFSDVLLCLDRDRLSGFVSPSLIATCGVMPLTILGTISDIMRHYHECIVQAKHEVLVSTFYFGKSEAQRTFSRALVELSKRVEARQKKGKVIVKC